MHPRSVFQEKNYFLNYNLSEVEVVIELIKLDSLTTP